MRRLLYVVPLILVMLGTAPEGSGVAAGPARAAVLVRFGDGQTVVRTAELGDAVTTGWDLLVSTGLDIQQEQGAVCKIGPDGCDYPQQACFCQAGYWSYWHWESDAWRYASRGAAARILTAGAVDAWTWGVGLRPQVVSPTLLLDDRRLALGQPTATPSSEGLSVQVDTQGDANHNAAVEVAWRRLGSATMQGPVQLQRQSARYIGLVGAGLSGGEYLVTITGRDPDGLNGSDAWSLRVTISGTTWVYLPVLASAGV